MISLKEVKTTLGFVNIEESLVVLRGNLG